MSGKRKIILKIEITLLVFIATLTSLTLAFTPDRASAPADTAPVTEQSDVSPTVDAADTQSPTDTAHSVPDETRPPAPSASYTPEPEDRLGDRYVIQEQSEKDISTGDLILVNYDHYYEIPENGDLVLAGVHKSRSYVLLDGNAMLAEKIMGPLNAMLDDFYAETGINNILLNSSFRTLTQQQAALNTWVKRIGAEGAAMMASTPGYSEHHTGLAFDFAIYHSSNDSISTFKGTGKYAWIHENAYKYGFILRYPEDKQEITKTSYEPWHFRYIGVPHSFFVVNKGYSYEEYMEYLMRCDFYGTHAFLTYNGMMYEIYYVSGTSVPVPTDADYTISGNNKGGFIVTVNRGPAGELAAPERALTDWIAQNS